MGRNRGPARRNGGLRTFLLTSGCRGFWRYPQPDSWGSWLPCRLTELNTRFKLVFEAYVYGPTTRFR